MTNRAFYYVEFGYNKATAAYNLLDSTLWDNKAASAYKLSFIREFLHLSQIELVGSGSLVGLSSKSQVTPTSSVTTTTSCIIDDF
jgi:hypothetical protein